MLGLKKYQTLSVRNQDISSSKTASNVCTSNCGKINKNQFLTSFCFSLCSAVRTVAVVDFFPNLPSAEAAWITQYGTNCSLLAIILILPYLELVKECVANSLASFVVKSQQVNIQKKNQVSGARGPFANYVSTLGWSAKC